MAARAGASLTAVDDRFLAALETAGVSEATRALLQAELIATPRAVIALPDLAWSHLLARGVRIGEHPVILDVAHATRGDERFEKHGSRRDFQISAYVVSGFSAGPALVLGIVDEFGPYSASRPLTWLEQALLVALPGVIYQLLLKRLVEKVRTAFSLDVLRQRSNGISLRESQRSNLTNMAIVAALLLTVIIAMIQADPPSAEGADRLLAQWYALFLAASTVPLFGAVVMSSLLLLYIEPLDDDAALNFISSFINYFGEPIISTVVGIFNFVPALSLWAFGVYGFWMGVLYTFSSLMLMRKVVLTQLYLSTWENSALDAETREQRERQADTKVHKLAKAAAARGGGSPRKHARAAAADETPSAVPPGVVASSRLGPAVQRQ